MPFDIRHRSALAYDLGPRTAKRGVASTLAGRIQSAIRPIAVELLESAHALESKDGSMSVGVWSHALVFPDDPTSGDHTFHLTLSYGQKEPGDHAFDVVFLRNWGTLFSITPTDLDGNPVILETPRFDMTNNYYGMSVLPIAVDINPDCVARLKACDKVALRMSKADKSERWRVVWSGLPGELLSKAISASEFALENEPLDLVRDDESDDD